MFIIDNLKFGHFFTTLLLWFERWLIKQRTGNPSILKEIDDGIFKNLTKIAIRKPRSGNNWKGKSAIVRLVGIQFSKISTFIVFISYFILLINKIIENFSIFLVSELIFAIFALLVILPIIDLVLWGPQIEAKLCNELKVREAEFGLHLANPPPLPTKGIDIGMEPPSIDKLNEVFKKKKTNADELGLSMTAYTQRRWAEHFGVIDSSNLDNSSTEALREYLAGDD